MAPWRSCSGPTSTARRRCASSRSTAARRGTRWSDLNVSSSAARRLRRRAPARRQRARAHHRHPEEHRLRLRPGRRSASTEDFGLRLARHFAGRVRLDHRRPGGDRAYGWDRIAVGGRPHDHAFTRAGGEVRTAVVTVDGDDSARARRADRPGRPEDDRLGVLGLPARPVHHAGRDRRPDPGHRGHRPLAATPAADVDWADSFAGVRPTLLETFATRRTRLALQQTLYAMGEAVLERHGPSVAEIRLSMPNKHHFLQDLIAVRAGQPDDGRLPRRRPAVRADRGHRACATTRRPAEAAWEGTPAFC